MKPIDDTNLALLVEDANRELLGELRDQAKTKVRALFQRKIALFEEKKRKDHELSKITRKLESIEAQITRLRAGDWSVLTEGEKDGEPTGA